MPQRRRHVYLIDFTIVDDNFSLLLGLVKIKLFVVRTYNSLSVEDTSPHKVEKPKFRKDAVMSEYLDIFGKDITSMEGKVLFETDRTVVRSVMPPINIPFLLKEKLKNILDLLTHRKVISPFQEPKD